MSHLTVLSAGTGAVRFLLGLLDVRPEEEVHVVANVGNDCQIWGLYSCPDIDLILNVLAGEVDPYRPDPDGGSTECFNRIRKLGMPSWRLIRDRDLATCLLRSDMLRSGARLEDVTSELAERFGLGVRLMPVTNDPLRTTVQTSEGPLAVLQYLAGHPSSLSAAGVTYAGADTARAASGVIESILDADRVILAPADPIIGLGALLAVQDVRNALARTRASVVAVSPLLGSHPVRGEPHSLLDLTGGAEPPTVRLARGLGGAVDSLIINTTDLPIMEAIRETGIDAWADKIIIESRDDARRLAGRVAFGERAIARRR